MTRRRVVIADANVLINLLHVGRLEIRSRHRAGLWF